MSIGWTQDRVQQLHALRKDGKLYRDIAQLLGTTIGSVIGRVRTERKNPSAQCKFIWSKDKVEKLTKLRAEGLDLNSIAQALDTPGQAVWHKARREKIGASRFVRLAPRPIRDAGPLPGTTPVTLLNRTGCAWPINDGGPYLFCNATKRGTSPYCPHHAIQMVRSG